MTIKGRRIFNSRPICFATIFIVLGIIIAESLYKENALYYLIPAILFLAVVITFITIPKCRKFIYIPLAFIVGLSGMSISNAVYDANLISSYEGEFSARVASEIVVEDGWVSFEVEDITINDVTLKYNGYVRWASDSPDIDYNAGDILKLKGVLYGNEHIKFDTYYASNRANNMGYYVRVYSVDKLEEGEASFPINIQMAIKKLFAQNLDEHTASICQALVLGDKTGIDDTLYSNIQASGLAHVLAVSGLHVSTLATAIYFLLKKLEVNPKISFVIVFVLTFIYSMLCSFTASSLRACIMSGIFNFASAFSKKKDNLSTISFSAILILIFRPTALLEVGFLLSFYSVLGIFLFGNTFERIGMKVVNKISPKRHIGKSFAKVCAISFATNLTTYPLVAHFFGNVPTLFVLSNFIILPYIMVVYVILIVMTLLSLITTFGGFTWIMRFLMLPFRWYTNAIGSLSFATIPTMASSVFIIFFTIALLLLSKYVFLPRRTKVTGVIMIASIDLVVFAISMCI